VLRTQKGASCTLCLFFVKLANNIAPKVAERVRVECLLEIPVDTSNYTAISLSKVNELISLFKKSSDIVSACSIGSHEYVHVDPIWCYRTCRDKGLDRDTTRPVQSFRTSPKSIPPRLIISTE
jgi:hypothetical protein